jgi:hypothetical protein
MSVFIQLDYEPTVQVDDKIRLDASKTFIAKTSPAITIVEIQPTAAASFYVVTGTSSKDWYLDWAYSAAATNVVTVRVTVTGGATTTKAFNISSVTSATDALWSSDNDLTLYEPEVLKYLPTGWSSYKRMHRRAQATILNSLDERRIWDINGNKFVKGDLITTTEVRDWSIALALQYIFEGMSNQLGDVFGEKAKKYATQANDRGNRAVIRIDYDKSGAQGNIEGYDQFSASANKV